MYSIVNEPSECIFLLLQSMSFLLSWIRVQKICIGCHFQKTKNNKKMHSRDSNLRQSDFQSMMSPCRHDALGSEVCSFSDKIKLLKIIIYTKPVWGPPCGRLSPSWLGGRDVCTQGIKIKGEGWNLKISLQNTSDDCTESYPHLFLMPKIGGGVHKYRNGTEYFACADDIGNLPLRKPMPKRN